MLFEHWIYSLAIANIVGMLYRRSTGRDHSWIIVGCAYAPDFDMCADAMLKRLGVTVLIWGEPIKHGDFHNIAAMILFAAAAALLLHPFGIMLTDSFFFASMGFCAHLLEDALVFDSGYAFLWPVSSMKLGIGILDSTRDFYGIANKYTLISGIVLSVLSFLLRTVYERNKKMRTILF